MPTSRTRPVIPPTPTPELEQAIYSAYQSGAKSWKDVNRQLVQQNSDWLFGSKTAFYKTCSIMKIPGSRKGALNPEQLNVEIRNLDGIHKTRGYRGVTHALSLKGLVVTRNAVYRQLQMIDPQGLQNRSRGSRRLRRFPIISAGPNEQWSMDGHDKLAMWGFGIYGIRDVYSGFLLALHAFPSNRLAANVHWLFLETILEQKGYPIQVASDRGSEMGQISETQFLLRQTYSTPELDDVPPHICLKSLRNITIERQWVHVRKEVVDLILEKIQEGLERGFVWTNPAHRMSPSITPFGFADSPQNPIHLVDVDKISSKAQRSLGE
ncbi:hypothetical protein M231_07902 [Tremella mesenterica]|uniref:Integrase core domain-containing protein n=1 Tax=Tremella mesenterica TaxID=5217 RepID=A0A4V1M2X0_TREME|nr:hypothetical protein M231_07902 [Tremella mesenterica]